MMGQKSGKLRAARFRAKLEPVPHGGQFVIVPAKVAEEAGAAYKDRVRGTVNGAPYRSSLMKYSGVFHLGIHKAALAEAGVKPGVRVEITLELDDEPLPTDVVPPDLAAALDKKRLNATWTALRPSLKREYVKQILEAKKPETRARRLSKVIDLLANRHMSSQSRTDQKI
jgi:hypothetical protein